MSLYRLLYGRSPGYPLRVLWHATRSQPREETTEGKREVEGGEVKSWRQEVCASSGYREISYPGTTNNSLFLSRPVLHRSTAIDRQKRTREFLCDTTSWNFSFRFFCHVVVVE